LLEWTHTPVKLVTVFIPGCCEHPGGDKCCYLPKNDQVHGPGRNQHVFKTKCSCKVNPRTIKDVFKQLQLGSCTGHCSLHGTCSECNVFYDNEQKHTYHRKATPACRDSSRNIGHEIKKHNDMSSPCSGTWTTCGRTSKTQKEHDDKHDPTKLYSDYCNGKRVRRFWGTDGWQRQLFRKPYDPKDPDQQPLSDDYNIQFKCKTKHCTSWTKHNTKHCEGRWEGLADSVLHLHIKPVTITIKVIETMDEIGSKCRSGDDTFKINVSNLRNGTVSGLKTMIMEQYQIPVLHQQLFAADKRPCVDENSLRKYLTSGNGFFSGKQTLWLKQPDRRVRRLLDEENRMAAP